MNVIASSLPVVPQLDDAVVQARQDPWALRVEGQALHPRTLKMVQELNIDNLETLVFSSRRSSWTNLNGKLTSRQFLQNETKD